MPSAAQDADGKVTVDLGAKGVMELELVSSGERWGRWPTLDVHSSLKAMTDSPAWHLVEALTTLVTADGNIPAIEGYLGKVRPRKAHLACIIHEGQCGLSFVGEVGSDVVVGVVVAKVWDGSASRELDPGMQETGAP